MIDVGAVPAALITCLQTMVSRRRIVRIVAWAGVTILGLLLLVAAAAAILLNSAWGHERIRQLIVSQSNRFLTGTLEIDGVSGSILRGIELDGVRLVQDEVPDFFATTVLQVGEREVWASAVMALSTLRAEPHCDVLGFSHQLVPVPLTGDDSLKEALLKQIPLGALGQAEDIAARAVQQHLLGQRQAAGLAVDDFGGAEPGLLQLAPLIDLIQPQFGIITSIGREHLEFFGDLAGKPVLVIGTHFAGATAGRAAPRRLRGRRPRRVLPALRRRDGGVVGT